MSSLLDKKPGLGDLTADLMELDDLSSADMIKFGVMLGLELEVVQKICREVDENIRLLKLLDTWLKSNDATYKRLVKALRHMKRKEMADEIEKKHSTSKSEEDDVMAAATAAGRVSEMAGGSAIPQTDLVTVMYEALLPAQNSAHFLGLKLGIPHHTVQGINKIHRDPRDFLLEIVSEFLKQVDEDEVWSRVVTALRSPSIRLNQLANQIAATHLPPPPPPPPSSSSRLCSDGGSTGSQPSPPPCGPSALSLPTLPLLLKFPRRNGGHTNIIQSLAANHRVFGVLLLDDSTGAIADALFQSSLGKPEVIVHSTLCRWLQGSGRTPRSWQTLATVLEDAELSELAHLVRDNLIT